jgi:hypothetical protein
MLIWDTKVSRLQWLGYTIAVAGLIYYKVGAETLKSGFQSAGREWAQFSAKHPVLRILIVFVTFIMLFGVGFTLVTPAYATDFKDRVIASATSAASAASAARVGLGTFGT